MLQSSYERKVDLMKPLLDHLSKHHLEESSLEILEEWTQTLLRYVFYRDYILMTEYLVCIHAVRHSSGSSRVQELKRLAENLLQFLRDERIRTFIRQDDDYDVHKLQTQKLGPTDGKNMPTYFSLNPDRDSEIRIRLLTAFSVVVMKHPVIKRVVGEAEQPQIFPDIEKFVDEIRDHIKEKNEFNVMKMCQELMLDKELRSEEAVKDSELCFGEIQKSVTDAPVLGVEGKHGTINSGMTRDEFGKLVKKLVARSFEEHKELKIRQDLPARPAHRTLKHRPRRLSLISGACTRLQMTTDKAP